MNSHELLVLGAGVNLGVLLSFSVTLRGRLVDDRRACRVADARQQATAMERP